MASNTNRKRGQFSTAEDNFLKQNFLDMSIPELSNYLSRTEKTIQKRIKDLGLTQTDVDDEEYRRLQSVLYGRPYWSEIKAQFPESEYLNERKYFEASWINTMADFGSDVKYQEELDIKHAITLDIRLNQISRQQTMNQAEIERIQKELDDAYSKDAYKRDAQYIIKLEQTQSQNKSLAGTYHGTYVKLLEERKNIIKLLKADRERRQNLTEDSSTTFSAYIRMLQDPGSRRKIGRDIELQRLAAEKVKNQLKEEHQYDDGEWDVPLLTPD